MKKIILIICILLFEICFAQQYTNWTNYQIVNECYKGILVRYRKHVYSNQKFTIIFELKNNYDKKVSFEFGFSKTQSKSI